MLNKFKSNNFKTSILSTYDFSTLYTTLPHHLIKDKLTDLINRTFIRENTQYLACNEECTFFTSDWMRRPTGDQEVAGSTPAEVSNILQRRLIMKYFLRSFSPFR